MAGCGPGNDSDAASGSCGDVTAGWPYTGRRHNSPGLTGRGLSNGLSAGGLGTDGAERSGPSKETSLRTQMNKGKEKCLEEEACLLDERRE